MNTTANETSGITFIDDLPFKRPPIYHMPPAASRELLPAPPEGYLDAMAYDLSKNDGSYWFYLDGAWSADSQRPTPDNNPVTVGTMVTTTDDTRNGSET